MANRLEMAEIQAITSLHERGWSQRKIAEALGVDRETVARYLREAQAAPKPATAPPGSGSGLEPPKPATAPPGSEGPDPAPAGPAGQAMAGAMAPPASDSIAGLPIGTSADAPPGAGFEGEPGHSACEPWRGEILALLEQGLSAKRIHQDLVEKHGFASSYYSVRRFVERLCQRRQAPFRRMECEPGAEAQVDFGTGAPVHDSSSGKKRRPHVFRIVLSHSRKGYSEAVYRQTTESFLTCLENAFWHFGGVPQTLVLDNLKAAVTRADWFEPEVHPKLRAFAEHYGIAILPTKPRMPRHKGKIERGVGYVKGNALKGRTFTSLEEENRFLQEWEATVADTRVHGTTRRQVDRFFQDVERPALRPLPRDRFPFFHEAQRTVHRDGHVEVARAYYSVPPEYVTRRVWVRWDARVVRIFNQRMEQVALHARQEDGRFSTHSRHIVTEKVNSVERGAAWLLEQAARLGAHAGRWAEGVVAARGVEGLRVLQGLLALARSATPEAVERACEVAAPAGAYRLRTVRELVKRQSPQPKQLEFLDTHPLIRSLSDYGELVRHSFHKEQI